MRRGLSRHNNRSAGGVAFSPLSLFADGSQGVWYDDSLTSSMFQTSTGVTPAVLESPVGLQLDLSQGLALGVEKATTFTTLRSTVTNAFGFPTVVTNNTGIGPFGIQGSNLATNVRYEVTLTFSGNTTGVPIQLDIGATSAVFVLSGVSGTSTAYVNAGAGTTWAVYANTTSGAFTINSLTIKAVAGNHRFQATSANRPILSARYNLLLATATLATQSITTVATSYTITFAGTGTVTLSGTYIGVFTAGTNTFTATAGTLTATVVGSVLTADIRPTNQTVTLPAYQAVVTSSSYDTVGFPQYIKYNGSNSSLSTASINFTATAQMSVFSGLRKLSDAAAGYAIELSVNSTLNSGAFYLSAPNSVAANFGAGSGGTTFVSGASASSFAAPITQTAQILANISAPSLNLYLNNTSVLSSTSTQGTGNYGNYAMYFGRRAGTSSPFNGQEFQTIIVGKTLTATEIANTETYVNSKTKAY